VTACTERHMLAPDRGLAGEGQKGMTKIGTVMTARIGRHVPEARP